MKKNISTLTAISFAAVLALAACGGGGGGGDSSGSSNGGSSASAPTGASAPSVTNLSTPQYAAGSAQLAAFNLLNQQRQQCGFSALQDNAALDQATQSHAQYLAALNSGVSDTEVSGNAGFTGVTYGDRAAHFGYPQTVSVGGVSGGFYTPAKLTEDQYGQQLVYGWLSGVYHIGVLVSPATSIGIGESETTFNGFPEVYASISVANAQAKLTSVPLTFPCQGTTGVAYSAGGETPTPPNTSGNWGTPVAVAGNLTDTIRLQSATMTDTSGNVITLQVLDSSSDPNNDIAAYEGVAYPKSPLAPNSTYAVSITGTINGTPFSRSFTFTTGNIVG
ncbi:CAP domain-containing protein [Paraburkholderia sp. CNPSo 3155]|uniref:CAP domain-containing protein n=1 Tax=Paraburkholderia atlantica TaxID=2654982 RepID=UPI00128B7C53|nr:CAP domain-containing protein [Paraburkholderia atlantica]MPW11241.1 CAP domain-containing protein [Paraburkholderia atlantica]